VNGSWFVWAVASQSLSIALTQVQPHLPVGQDWAAMPALVSWAVGLALYAATAFLLLLRVVHFGLTPRDAEPSFWVAMGAVAIAVVAGVGIGDLHATPAVQAAHTVIAGIVVILWGYCLWLIPLLAAMGIWRHVRHRVPLRYEPGLWSMVFPLGMIAVASTRIGELYALPAAHGIGTGLLLVAILAWALVFTGMLVHLLTGLRQTTEREQ
jgi:tellurite resistance protein TehA-like permease